ncbi:hypothetical protein TWF730_008891 [Orbilia blumenaviensis]|uniref:Uncharacterized protein n=1 Tax=Orbilia blumenaviensis TaxID=1796055 RepID=A0AAV9V3N8_9PEZI
MCQVLGVAVYWKEQTEKVEIEVEELRNKMKGKESQCERMTSSIYDAHGKKTGRISHRSDIIWTLKKMPHEVRNKPSRKCKKSPPKHMQNFLPGIRDLSSDRAARILERTLIPPPASTGAGANTSTTTTASSYSITSSLAQFADNLERFAGSDHRPQLRNVLWRR